MNLLIVGDGPEEWSWALALAEYPPFVPHAACPGFKPRPDLPGGVDLDGALALPGVEGVIVGGGPDLRMEALRRVAGAGLPALVLHPPGENADPYYQVALSRQETGGIVVPDCPARLHPGVEILRAALADGSLGAFRLIRYEAGYPTADADLARLAFPRVADVVRSLLGEVEAVTATGDPPGAPPTQGLVAQLRGPDGRRAEVRLEVVPHALTPHKLSAVGADATLTLEFDPDHRVPARLIRKSAGGETVEELPAWDPKGAILRAFADAAAGKAVHPDLTDGTRAMELAEAVARSLRRGRTVDLLYEEVSELGNFKAVMTTVGCGLIVGALVIVPLALAGAALGQTWMLYLAYALPVLMVLFLGGQFLRLAVRTPTREPKEWPGGDLPDAEAVVGERPA